jgi:protein associated with RNAse G/E
MTIYQTWKSKVTSVIIEDDHVVVEYTDEYGSIIRRDADKNYHSLSSPAIEFFNGNKYWFNHGKYHRLDGPAIECNDGSRSWYINNIFIGRSQDGFTPEDFEEYKINNNIVT